MAAPVPNETIPAIDVAQEPIDKVNVMNPMNLSIRQRLYFGFGAVVAILVVLIGIILNTTQALGKASQWSEHSAQVRQQLGNLGSTLVDMETGERGFLLTGNDDSLEPFNKGKTQFSEILAKVTQLTSDNPVQQKRLAELGKKQQEWLNIEVQPAMALRRAVQPDDTGMDSVIAFEQQALGKMHMDSMRVLLSDLKDAESVLNVQRVQETNEALSHVFWISLVGGIVAIVLATVLGVTIARSIVRPLREAEVAADAIAEGQLNTIVMTSRNDEIGKLLKAFKRMDDKLTEIVSDVRLNSESVSVAARQIAAGNDDLSRRTQEQAASLEQTAASMEEMTSTVKQNAENAAHANQLTRGVREQAQKGGDVVDKTIKAMSEINASSRKIVDIVSLIDEIAFQTNLLALNAAVEAARAGEQGRGFAVVASEVRNLASRSAAAAKDIKVLVEDSVAKVEGGSQLVDLSGKTLGEIVESVKKVSDIVAEIASASHEQASGIDQVNLAVAQMDGMTQQNAALVEEAAAASNSLETQAEALKRQVAFFKVGGEARAEERRVPAQKIQPSAPALPAAYIPKRTATVKKSERSEPASPKVTAAKSAPRTSTKPVAAADEWEAF